MTAAPVADGLEGQDQVRAALVTESLRNTVAPAKPQRLDESRVAERAPALSDLVFLAEIRIYNFVIADRLGFLFAATGSQQRQRCGQENG